MHPLTKFIYFNPMSMTVNRLNAEQERESNRDFNLEEYLNEKNKEFQNYIPFNDEVNVFYGYLGQIEAIIPVKGKRGIVITEEKKNLKTALAENVNDVCTTVTAYALGIGDKDLLHNVRFRTRDIAGAKDGNVVSIVTTITDAVTPLLTVEAFQKYQITADTLAALTDGAKAFSDTRGKASVVDIDSSIANGDLNNIFKNIRGSISRLHLLLNYFNKTNPSFVIGFKKAAALDYSNVHHSGIEGVITDPRNGSPVEGATITGQGKKKKAVTNKDGVYKLVKLKVTDMKITVTAPGYETRIINVKILRGKISKLDISLASLQSQVFTMATA